MANITAYEYLRTLLDEQAMDSIDGVIVGRSDNMVDVRVQGSSRVLRDISVPAYITYNQTVPGRRCSLGLHAGQAFLLAVFLDPADDSGVYAAQVIDLEVLDITVEAKPDGYHVSWETSSYAVYYELYGDADGDGSDIGLLYSGDETHYTVPYGQGWAYFAVRAVAIDGTTGPLSSWVTDALTPDVPTNVVVQAVEGGFEVSWDLMDKAASYAVEWAEDDQGSNVGTIVSGYNGDQLFVPADGTHTYFRVEAVGYDASQSGWSSWTDDTDAPPAPDIDNFSSRPDFGGYGFFLTGDLSAETSQESTGFRRWQVYVADDDQGTNEVLAGYMTAEEAVSGKRFEDTELGFKQLRMRSEDWAGNVSTYTLYMPIVVASTDYGPIEDKFDGYGGDLSDMFYKDMMVLAGMESGESWTAVNTTVSDDTANKIQGLRGKKIVGSIYGAGAELILPAGSRDLSDINSDDWITIGAYFHAAHTSGFAFTLSLYDGTTWRSATYSYGVGETLNKWYILGQPKSAFPDTMDWTNVERIGIYIQSQVDVTIDDFRVIRRDPDNNKLHDNMGQVWKYEPAMTNDVDSTAAYVSYDGPEWHILPGQQSGEPDTPHSLAQFRSGGSTWYSVYHPQSDVPSGVGIVGTYLKENGEVAFAFNIQDPVTRTMYAVEADSANDKIRLVKWVDGTRTQIAEANFTFAPDELVWIGADWRDPDSENRIKVYASKVEGNLIQANNLLISETDSAVTRGGYVGLMAKECNARFVYIRAGSPEHAMSAEFAYKAAVADQVSGDYILELKDKDNVVHRLGKNQYSTAQPGITLRTLTNPASGEPIFRVESSGYSPRLIVEHSGAVKTSNSDIYVGVGTDGTGGYKVYHENNPPPGGEITGEIRMWPTGTAPGGWLLCQGQAVSRTTYAALFAVIGTIFGAGDGSTTFNLPDGRGRSPQGADGTDAVGATPGTKMQTSVPQHRHGFTADTSTADGSNRVAMGNYSNLGTRYVNYAGVAGGVDQRGPRFVVNYIIKT